MDSPAGSREGVGSWNCDHQHLLDVSERANLQTHFPKGEMQPPGSLLARDPRSVLSGGSLLEEGLRTLWTGQQCSGFYQLSLVGNHS